MKSKNDRVVRTLASNQGLIESIVSKQQQQHNFPRLGILVLFSRVANHGKHR